MGTRLFTISSFSINQMIFLAMTFCLYLIFDIILLLKVTGVGFENIPKAEQFVIINQSISM